MHLDHVTIRTADLRATKEFFLSVFDVEEKPRPAAIQSIPGHWLYADDTPIVHLIGSHGVGPSRSGEAIDHVGIHLEGYSAFRAKLDRLDIQYSAMDLPELNERRIFFHTPGGTLLEAVFSEPSPAQGEHYQ